jgi:YesN/AraC family two-component response regulator
MNKISLNSLSQHLHINESYLSKLFKKETNINFTDYLNETRINKSLDLIKNTDLNLMDIALTVGFEDQSYFTKVFKKFVGETPKQYKLKELRNDLI